MSAAVMIAAGIAAQGLRYRAAVLYIRLMLTAATMTSIIKTPVKSVGETRLHRP